MLSAAVSRYQPLSAAISRWRRLVHAGLLSTLTLAAVGINTGPVQIGQCHNAARCAAIADTTQARDAIVAAQLAKFPCRPWVKGEGFPGSALVLHATKLDGAVSVDSVVERQSSAVAYANAKAGRVWIERWCQS